MVANQKTRGDLVTLRGDAPDWAQQLTTDLNKQLAALFTLPMRQYTPTTLPSPARPRSIIWVHGSSNGNVPAYSDEAGAWRFFSDNTVVT